MIEVTSIFLNDKFLVLCQHIIANTFYTLNAIYYVSNIFRKIIFLAVGMGHSYDSFDFFVRLGVQYMYRFNHAVSTIPNFH